MPGDPILLSTAYLGPVRYFCKMAESGHIIFEQHEHFIKQTYRNRCVVYGANGPIALVIPLADSRGGKTKIKDLRIFNQLNWQHNHWRTIFSAYNSSPFFEYYRDGLNGFYKKRREFLLDFNMELQDWVFGLLDFKPPVSLTSEYEENPDSVTDFRNTISPKLKREDSRFKPKPYSQVFEEKFGFYADLSIIDLLFNVGPGSFSYLEECIG